MEKSWETGGFQRKHKGLNQNQCGKQLHTVYAARCVIASILTRAFFSLIEHNEGAKPPAPCLGDLNNPSSSTHTHGYMHCSHSYVQHKNTDLKMFISFLQVCRVGQNNTCKLKENLNENFPA